MSEQLANCKQRQEKLGSENTCKSGHFDKKLQRFFTSRPELNHN